ncbi:MAG: hypothetical protein M3Q07_06695, partial [Pseudobdellovibrionaceae bacterium]|nr:hypothetical protein [Pseudobdellovibrionaceae bacterium]
MRELIPTGIAGLDDILLGGVLKGNVIVVEGMPGTGKSTMALEFLYRGARDFHEPGLIVCFETSAQKLVRDAAGFGWDILALVRENKLKILELQPSVLIDELQSETGVLSQEVARIGAKRVVIDGLTPLRNLNGRDNGQILRETLHRLWLRFASLNVTALLTTEVSCNHPIGEAGAHEEQFLADTLITLRKEARRRSVHRSIEIAKSRGQDFFSGRHAFAIQPEVGVSVFPRVYARPKHYEV